MKLFGRIKNEDIVNQIYNKDKFHLKHALIVEGVMRYFAKELGYIED